MSVLRHTAITLSLSVFWAVGGAARAEDKTPAVSPAPAEAPADETKPLLTAAAESLATANADAEKYKTELERLTLQTEALGLSALSPDIRELQERLVSAVNDLRLTRESNNGLTERLVSLSEAALALLSDPASTEGRDRLRRELADANRDLVKVRDSELPAPAALAAAKVVSKKAEIGLVVINVGEDSGLRVGTPMKIVRDEKTVASGLIVDIRNRIAGLLITSESGRDSIQVGDSAKPETTQNLQQ